MSRVDDLQEQAELAVAEQVRAGEWRGARKQHLADDPDCPNFMRLAALGEEYGEVCRALHDGEPEQLALELTQLAGVALAWGVALSYQP